MAGGVPLVCGSWRRRKATGGRESTDSWPVVGRRSKGGGGGWSREDGGGDARGIGGRQPVDG